MPGSVAICYDSLIFIGFEIIEKMKAIPSDTTIEAAKRQFEIMRKLGPQRRIEMAFDMSNNLRDIVEAGVRMRHPDYDGTKVKEEVLRLMIGEDLYNRIRS
jgi:hypothetical protein